MWKCANLILHLLSHIEQQTWLLGSIGFNSVTVASCVISARNTHTFKPCVPITSHHRLQPQAVDALFFR
jgi:hypothetical protein